MRRSTWLVAGAILAVAQAGQAADFEVRMMGGSIQLGGQILLSVRDGDKSVPQGASCDIEIADPFAAHLQIVSADCAAMKLQQGNVPILDDAGYAIPSAQVPYQLVVRTSEGAEGARGG